MIGFLNGKDWDWTVLDWKESVLKHLNWKENGFGSSSWVERGGLGLFKMGRILVWTVQLEGGLKAKYRIVWMKRYLIKMFNWKIERWRLGGNSWIW